MRVMSHSPRYDEKDTLKTAAAPLPYRKPAFLICVLKGNAAFLNLR